MDSGSKHRNVFASQIRAIYMFIFDLKTCPRVGKPAQDACGAIFETYQHVLAEI
jgi:hypothetical protein